MNKFKVGDKVRIKEEHTSNWVPSMYETVGKIGEIKEVGLTTLLVYIGPYSEWYYYPDSLEPVEESQEHAEDCKVEVCGVTISGDTESVKKFLLDMAVQCAKAEDAYMIQKLNNLAKEARDYFKTFYAKFERLENGI